MFNEGSFWSQVLLDEKFSAGRDTEIPGGFSEVAETETSFKTT